MKLKVNYRNLAIIIVFLNLIFVISNPDPYLGIADYYIFFIVFFLCTYLLKVKIRFDNFLKYMLVLLFCGIIEIVNAGIHGTFSTGYILSYSIYIVFFILLINMKFNESEIVKLINGYVLSAFIISIWLLVQRYEFYEGWDARHTVKFLSNKPIDPNFLAAFLVFPCLIIFAKMLYSFSLKKLIVFIIIFSGLLYTASRGAAVSTFIGMMFVIFDFIKGKNKLLKLLMIVLGGVLAIILISYFIPMSSLNRIFDIESYNDKSNAKRMVDWMYGLYAFIERPLIGYGLRGEASIIQSALGIKLIAHNTYVAFILQFGILGLLIISIGIVNIFILIKNNKVLVGEMAATLIVSIFVSAETALFFWLPLIFIMVIGRFEIQEGKKYLWLQ